MSDAAGKRVEVKLVNGRDLIGCNETEQYLRLRVVGGYDHCWCSNDETEVALGYHEINMSLEESDRLLKELGELRKKAYLIDD